jgi:hypothetical protein
MMVTQNTEPTIATRVAGAVTVTIPRSSLNVYLSMEFYHIVSYP